MKVNFIYYWLLFVSWTLIGSWWSHGKTSQTDIWLTLVVELWAWVAFVKQVLYGKRDTLMRKSVFEFFLHDKQIKIQEHENDVFCV